MKKSINYIFCVACAILVSSALNAQSATVATGYFADGYVGKNKLNPAMTPNAGYIGMPFLNLGSTTYGNFALKDVVFPQSDGTLKLFCSNDIDYRDVFNRLPSKLNLVENIDLSILSMGFFNKTGSVYTTAEIGFRMNSAVNMSKDAIALIKGYDGSAGNNQYDLSGSGAHGIGYGQIAFGQSFKAKKLRIGYKLKFLFGAGYLDFDMSQFNATLDKNQWDISAKGTITHEPVVFGTKTLEDGSTVLDFSKIKLQDPKTQIASNILGNFGFAGDLGFTWDILDYLQLSAAVQDIGFVGINHANVAVSDHLGENAISYGNESYGGSDIGKEVQKFIDKLGTLSEFQTDGSRVKVTEMLPMIVRAGVQFRIPVYQKFSLGVLYSQQFHKQIKWWEVRGSANYDILRWLACSVSYANGTYGSQFGAFLNLHTTGINFYVGADNIPFKYSAQGIPVNTFPSTVSIGINFLFDEYFGRYPKKQKENI